MLKERTEVSSESIDSQAVKEVKRRTDNYIQERKTTMKPVKPVKLVKENIRCR